MPPGRIPLSFDGQACLFRSLVADRHEANLVARLADAYHATGDHAAAREAWRRALPILENLGNLLGPSCGFPDIHQIRAKLHQHRPT
ncbi:MAG TPA: hypothetical protein VFO16_09675 [Pseudonocardiaceae bacterium]|nr:hypothetical protein [Pseudonocardiaceae bacterium]